MTELWELLAMEGYGYLDTKESHIQRIARYLRQTAKGEVDDAFFFEACKQCGIDPYEFDQKDILRIQDILDQI